MKKVFIGFVVSLSLALPLGAMGLEQANPAHAMKQLIVKLGVNLNLNQEEIDAMELPDLLNHLNNNLELTQAFEQPGAFQWITPTLDEELDVAAAAVEDEPGIDIPTAAAADEAHDVALATLQEMGQEMGADINFDDPVWQNIMQFSNLLLKQMYIEKLDA